MTAIVLIFALVCAGASAGVVELSCSDNATCIDNFAREFARGLRQQKTMRLFDTLTLEPLRMREARSNQGLLKRFLDGYAFSYDWNDYTFRFSKPENRDDALDLEMFVESKSAKDVSEPNPKKSASKVEEEEEDVSKAPKILRRRQKKKVLQAVIPLLFGMKSAGAAVLAFAVVTTIVLKAFVASKMALFVTAGMALKKLYETYGHGVGLHNHPYLYSQYPIDFPSASSHAYSVSGVSPQFGSPEMYSPTAMATHQQGNDLLQQQNELQAQQSQQAPTIQLVNSTRASERWDGKSKLLRFLEPIVDGFRSVLDPIANVFYDAMPATFRGLNSDVSTTKNFEPTSDMPVIGGTIEEVKKPKEILRPQPRNIAQRKMNYRKNMRNRPKKYTELKIDLDRLKQNKDLYDYVKTKKYKFNYPHTYYYPRVKYFVNPSIFTVKPNNSRLIPYHKEPSASNISETTNSINSTILNNVDDEWTPIVVNEVKEPILKRNAPKHNKKSRKNNRKRRTKRSLDADNESQSYRNSSFESKSSKVNSLKVKPRGFFDAFEFLLSSDPVATIIKHADGYTKSVIQGTMKTKKPPHYYTLVYDMLMIGLDIIDGLVNDYNSIGESFKSQKKILYRRKQKTSKRTKKIKIRKTVSKVV